MTRGHTGHHKSRKQIIITAETLRQRRAAAEAMPAGPDRSAELRKVRAAERNYDCRSQRVC